MAYTYLTEIKSVDDAREVIDYSFLYGDSQIVEALKFLKDHNETLPASVMFDPDDYIDIDGTRRKAASMYETRQDSLILPIDVSVAQKADDFVRDLDARSNSIVKSYEEENVVDGAPISAYDSYNALLKELEAYEDEHNANGTWREIVKDINAKTEFGKGSKLEEVKLSDTLWQTVKTNILRNRTLSKDWQDAMRAGAMHDFLKEEIYSAYLTEAEVQAKAMEVPEPQGKEKEIGSQEHADFIAGIYKKAKEIFEDLGQKGKKLKITENSAVVGAATAYAKFKEFTEYLKVKRNEVGKRIYGSKLVQAAEAYANKLDAKMEKDHPKLWGKFKNFALGIRASKYQIAHYAIGGAVVGAAGLVGAGVGTTALGLFSAYTAVGAWVYPIIQRKQMELIKARKEDPKNARKWEGKAGFMRAWNAIWYKEGKDGEKKTNWREGGIYLVKGVIGSAASFAVMEMATNWLGHGKALSDAVTNSSIGHWLQGMVKAPEAVKTQALATFNRSIVRTIGAIVPSVATVAGDTTDLAFNIVTWNKKGIKRAWDNLKGSLLGLGIVGAISGVSLEAQAAMINHQYAPDADVKTAAPEAQEPTALYKDENGYTMVEDGDKVVLKHGDDVVKEYAKSESWDNATDEQKANFAQQEAEKAQVAAAEADAARETAEAAAKEQAVLNKFKAFLPTDEKGNAFIPTNAEEANMTNHEWKVFNQRLSGIIGTEEGAAHIGVAQVDPDAVREEALMNLMKYMSENPDAFPAGSNPLKVLNDGLEAHYYSVTHGYYDGDGHWIAEKYKWIEMDGKEVEVMGRFAKVGDGDTYGRVTGDYLCLNGQRLSTYAKIGDTDTYGRVSNGYLVVDGKKLKIDGDSVTINDKQVQIERGYVQLKNQMVQFETGYAKVGDQMVQFNPATDAKITVDGTEYNVGSKWLHGDKNVNAFMDIICKGNTGSKDLSMANSIQTLNAAADHSLKTGEGSNAVGIGRNCDDVTVFKFAKKHHAPVIHRDRIVESEPASVPEPEKPQASGTTVVTDVATPKQASGTTVVTDTGVEKPSEDHGSSYLVVRRRGVNTGTQDNLPGSKNMKGHDTIEGVTVIKPQNTR